jgi:hypothetical protein
VWTCTHFISLLRRNGGLEKTESWVYGYLTHDITPTLDRTLRLPLHTFHLHHPYTRESGSDLHPRYDHGVQHLLVYLIFTKPFLFSARDPLRYFLLSAHTLKLYRWAGVWIFALWCASADISVGTRWDERRIRRYFVHSASENANEVFKNRWLFLQRVRLNEELDLR